ncbi:hypothetical protein N008_01265 [Hymenobacter sp. APR13]|nr:hypothetical protein N008_01265 [Hymenobacter sp. APR13]
MWRSCTEFGSIAATYFLMRVSVAPSSIPTYTMAAYTLGDTVRLQSGGPVMTIVKLTLKETTCTWFDEQNRLQGPVTFPRDAVQHVPAASSTAKA